MSLPLSKGVTAFVGDNGAGKTSILDAIHLLGTGKPFSTHRIDNVIKRDAAAVQVVGHTTNPSKVVLGVRRNRGGSGEARIGGAPVKALSELAKAMPLVVINSDTLNVVRAGPEGRRRFIDSFVFHVEQSFAQTSRRYMHALKQRNALLRERRGVDDSVWVRDLAEAGEFLVSSRRAQWRRYPTRLWMFWLICRYPSQSGSWSSDADGLRVGRWRMPLQARRLAIGKEALRR